MHMMVPLTSVANMSNDPMLVKNHIITVVIAKAARVSLFDKVWPKRMSGCSGGLKK